MALRCALAAALVGLVGSVATVASVVTLAANPTTASARQRIGTDSLPQGSSAANPNESAAASLSDEPADPFDSDGVTDATESEESTESGEPEDPTESEEPTELDEPTAPTAPTRPVEPDREPDPEVPAPPAGPAPTIEPRCWMGANRPLYAIHNQDPQRSLAFTLSSSGAGKRGVLGPKGSGTDTAWFVGTGTFPYPSVVIADYQLGGGNGTVVAPDAGARYCTYTLQPMVRWLDRSGNFVMPTAEQVRGWTLRLDGPLDSLSCTWNGAGLACKGTPKDNGLLPPGTYSVLDQDTALHVPAFDTTTYSVRASADPPGFHLVGGIGDFALPDLADGLTQDSVDERAPNFFPARLQQGTSSQLAPVTMEGELISAPQPPAPGPGTSGPPATAPTSPPAQPGQPTSRPRPGSSTSAPEPAFTLPETGGDPQVLVTIGAALAALGGLAVVIAQRAGRRRPAVVRVEARGATWVRPSSD